jgi:hypothetical protein
VTHPQIPRLTAEQRDAIDTSDSVTAALCELVDIFRIPVTNSIPFYKNGDPDLPVFELGTFLEEVIGVFERHGWEPVNRPDDTKLAADAGNTAANPAPISDSPHGWMVTAQPHAGVFAASLAADIRRSGDAGVWGISISVERLNVHCADHDTADRVRRTISHHATCTLSPFLPQERR